MEQETLMLFCVIIKKVPQSCKISRDSCLMILNHFLWFYCNPEPLYFSQILFQTIRHWSKVSLLLIFFRYPTYSGGDLVAKSYLTPCYLVDNSPPGSSAHGILQARILEWAAFPFSRGSSQPRDWTRVSRIAGRRFTIWATREALWETLAKE